MNPISAITALAAAFLLFQVQPILAKQLLPHHGGSAAVWTTCLLFFQALLVAGYAYAHRARPRLHVAVVAVSLLALPLTLRDWGTTAGGGPTLRILASLLASAGFPYAVLASTSPLLQRWMAAAGERDPYRLYALSNIGSLAALLSYPFAVEPWLAVSAQRMLWSAGYVVFAAGSAVCALRAAAASGATVRSRDSDQAEPAAVSAAQLAWWTALAACGSGLLMATTNQMCQEIAPIPFLWTIPLALYLLSFIVTFERPQWYNRNWNGFQAGICIAGACTLAVLGLNAPVWLHILVDTLTLFVCLLLCHGELAGSRPPAAALTRFYMAIAAGGALGGALVAVGAPLVFSRYAEYPLLLASCAGLVLVARYRAGELRALSRMAPLARAQVWSLAFGVLAPFLVLSPGQVLEERRNFYGSIRVTEGEDAGGRRRVLTHGQTTHGMQYQAAGRQRDPTAYYGWASAAGIALEEHPRRATGPLHAGIIGLGVGTLARYAREGDGFRFYEINPQVTAAARRWFTYLGSARGGVEVVEGDARLVLRDEAPRGYDVLIVDAFSSDAIPTHLLTTECAAVYRRHLAPGGVLLIHVSNRTLDLEPVVNAMAARLNWAVARIESRGEAARGTYDATWMALAADAALLDKLYPGKRAGSGLRRVEWSDDFASLWPLVRR